MQAHGGAFGLVREYAYGRAFPQLVTIPDFLGNTTGTYKVGGAYVERVTSVSFSLQAVGGAGTRSGAVRLLDQGGVTFSGSVMPFTVAAGNTSVLVFDLDANPGGAANSAIQVTSLPAPFLEPTYAVQIAVLGGLVADHVTHVRILTEKFSTAPADYSPGQGGEGHDWMQELAEQRGY
jgi:hypothetical protein